MADTHTSRPARRYGESGMAPAAWLEAWIWSMAGGTPKVTFGGVGPRGDRAWRIAVWRAIAAEALAVAEEEEGTRATGRR